MRIITFLILAFSLDALADIKTVADYNNNVICNYLQTEPFVDKVRTNIHAGNASLSCVKVKKLPPNMPSINSSPIKMNTQKNTGLICYTIMLPAYRDDRRGHMHGGQSAISCLESAD